MKKPLLFALLFSVFILLPGCTSPEDAAEEKQRAYEEAYEKGFEAGQEAALEGIEYPSVEDLKEHYGYEDPEAAYDRGVEDGYAQGYQDCLDEYGITEEEW